MPIYAYRCTACGHAKDLLQKMSDAVLTVCPACGASSFTKQLTAAGFQLKGSGWYVTDFRGGNAGAPKAAEGAEAAAAGTAATDKPADKTPEKLAEKSPERAADKTSDKTATKLTPAPGPAPAATPPSTGAGAGT